MSDLKKAIFAAIRNLFSTTIRRNRLSFAICCVWLLIAALFIFSEVVGLYNKRLKVLLGKETIPDPGIAKIMIATAHSAPILFYVPVIVLGYFVCAQRLRDINLSGKWVFAHLLLVTPYLLFDFASLVSFTIMGLIVWLAPVIVLWSIPGTEEKNRFDHPSR